MANLFGTNPNQAPLNSMLGNLAFQDKAYVSIDKVGIGTTFVDSGTAGQILQVYGGGAYISGRVGIGSTNPQETLDVQGGNGFIRIGEVASGYNGITLNNSTVDSDYNFLSSASDQTLYINRPANRQINFRISNSTDQMVLNSSGNLGINSSSPTSRLDVIGDAKILGVSTFTAANASAVVIRSGASGSYSGLSVGRTGGDLTIAVTGGSGQYANDSVAGDLVIRTESTSAKLLFTNGATNSTLAVAGNNVLVGTVSSTGTASQPLQVSGGAYVSDNLGIGVTNPDAKLSVFSSGVSNAIKNATNATNGYSYYILQNTGASGREYHFGLGGSATGGILAGSAYLYDATAGATRWYTDSSGNFIVGSSAATGTASQKLQVTGGAYVSGSVGIGTTNPGALLHLQSTSPIIRFTESDGFDNSKHWNMGVNAGELFWQARTDADLPGSQYFRMARNSEQIQTFEGLNTGSTWFIINNATQRVGVKTATPTQELDVRGNVAVSGNIGIGTTNPSSTLTVQGNSLFTGILTARNAATQDSISLNGRAGGTSSFNLSLTPTTLAASRTVTFQDVSGTVYVSGGTDIPLADGGTNASLTASNGGIVYSTSTAMAITSAGTSGQVLTSNGAAAPTWQDAAVSGIGIRTEGSIVGTGITLIDFRGPGVSTITAPVAGITTINMGGGSITVSDDTSTNATRYLLFEDLTSGSVSSVNVSSTKLQFNPSTGTLSATVFTSLSDRTQKTDITPITNAIETVQQLNGVKYKWIDNHNQPSIGVIAQEIEKVLPEVVITNKDGLKSVSYGNIVGLLIEAIKEQQIRIEELERKLNA